MSQSDQETGASTSAAPVRLFVAVLVLLSLYFTLSLLIDDSGGLGTDSGAKVATLEAMSRGDTLDPDVGYWAERWDSDGSLHPLYNSLPAEGGRWIAVTTLPMLLAAYPLYNAFGMQGALLLPMFGTVLAALCARRLALVLGAPSGWPAFWAVGLASPLVVYALDFWEHSLGVALMGWAVVFMLVAQRSRPVASVLAAGLLFGLAASMRSEALVYALVTLVVALWFIWRAGEVRRALVATVTFVGGLTIVLAGNHALESAVLGGQLRAGRSSGTIGGAFSDPVLRLKEAVVMTFGTVATFDVVPVVMGVGLAVALLFLVRRSGGGRDGRVSPLLYAFPFAFYSAPIFSGLGFVPGLIPSSPTAMAADGKAGNKAFVLAIALLSLPLVWATDYTGGVLPQWGGRYILVSGFLLIVLGVVNLQRAPQPTRVVFAALSLGVTLYGVAWTIQRADGVADWRRGIFTDERGAYIAAEPFLLREFGAAYTRENKWLSPVSASGRQEAALVMSSAGERSFEWIDEAGSTTPDFQGWSRAGTRVVPGVVDLAVTRYERSSS